MANKAKSFYCVFCQDIASLRVGDSAQFQEHMETVHRIFYEFDILMSINFIDQGEKNNIIERVRSRLCVGANMEKDSSVQVYEKQFNEVKTENIIDEFKEQTADNIETLQMEKTIKSNPEKDNKFQAVLIDFIKSEQNYIKLSKYEMKIKLQATKESKCELCERIFRNQQKVQRHKAWFIKHKSSCKKEVAKCNLCNRRFSFKGALKTHMKRPCKKVVDCETCGRVVKEDYYFSHRKSLRCQNDVDMTCKNCLKQFKSRRKAKYHSKMCRKRLHCEKCNRKMTPLRFIGHMCFLVPADLKCKNCLRSYKSSITIRKHILMKDCNTRIKCETCGERIVVEKLEEHKDNNRKCRKLKEKKRIYPNGNNYSPTKT